MSCRICGSASLQRFETIELFHRRERFDYQACGTCGTVQIAEIPPDLRAQYPPEYFATMLQPQNPPAPDLAGLAKILGRWPQSFLDVGCGLGAGLRGLAGRRVGVDPFTPVTCDQARADGWELVRSLDEVSGVFDIISSTHSLEHVPDIRATLAAMVERLAPGGRILLEMPVIAGPLPARYGVSWAGADPGRHLTVLTIDTFTALAREAGLVIEGMMTAADPAILSLSTMAAEGIPWASAQARRRRATGWAGWAREAAELTRAGAGDVGGFLLRSRP